MRVFLKVVLLVLLILAIFYGYLWYASRQVYPVEFGISFSKEHAESLGLDWKKVYLAILDDLKPKYIRIAATWSEVESQPAKFIFDDVDWQFNEAQKKGVKILLVVGQKAPRWPECHVPGWANTLPDNQYRKKLFNYVKTVVERYKDNPAMDIWQVENEPFIRFAFGDCQHFDREIVPEEINYVHLLDLNHKILVTDSGELSSWRRASQAGDLFGTTVYRIVRTPQGWYWNYDWLPAAFYRFKAQFWGRNVKEMFVSELQAEPWFTNGNPVDTPIIEQEKSMNPDRLKKHINYVEKIGVPRAYMWGVEWWYWTREKQHDERYWNIVKEKFTLLNSS